MFDFTRKFNKNNETNKILMQLTTKLLKLRLVQFGIGVNVDWRNEDLSIKTKGHYPKKVYNYVGELVRYW